MKRSAWGRPLAMALGVHGAIALALSAREPARWVGAGREPTQIQVVSIGLAPPSSGLALARGETETSHAPATSPAREAPALSNSLGTPSSLANLAEGIRARTAEKLVLPAAPPGSLIRAGGEVTLRLVLSATGALTALEVERPSGVAALDQAARQAVQAAAPFTEAVQKVPGYPGGEFRLPIRFQRR